MSFPTKLPNNILAQFQNFADGSRESFHVKIPVTSIAGTRQAAQLVLQNYETTKYDIVPKALPEVKLYAMWDVPEGPSRTEVLDKEEGARTLALLKEKAANGGRNFLMVAYHRPRGSDFEGDIF